MVEWRPLAGHLAARIAGRGPRVVFLHGFTQTATSWEPVAAHFAARGHEVVLVDLPGHGGSSGIEADLRRSADLIATTAGRATVIGYSLGGRIALHLALMYPHLVERLVVLGAHPGIADESERAQRRAADEVLAQRVVSIGVAAFLDEWAELPLFTGFTPSPADRAERERNSASGLAASLRLCGTGTQLSLWERLVELNMPVLAMAGEHDAKFVPIAERIAASTPDGTFATIHSAGHPAHLQQPLQVITRVETWMRGARLPAL